MLPASTGRLTVALLLSVALGVPSLAFAGTVRDDVAQAHRVMKDWVGDGTNGRRWREYLMSESLDRELALGRQADPLVVGEILQKYQSGVAGLNRAKFDQVRRALLAWKAELELPTAAELPILAREAKGDYQPVSPDQVAAAQQKLRAAVGRLDTYLNTGGANGQAWKDYLLWDQLTAQVQPGAEVDIRALAQVFQQFTSNYLGLELPVFADVASALRSYVDLAAGQRLPNLQRQYERQLESLAESLQRYASEPTETDHWNIGQRLGWLTGMRQAPQLIDAVRHSHSQPNVYIQASDRFIAAGISQPVNEVRPFRDSILGTAVSGMGHTTGAVSSRLVPSTNQAVIETVFNGYNVADSVGRNGPAIIYSDGYTNFTTRKRTVIDEFGLHATPAETQARTSSQVKGLATTKRCFLLDRLIKGIARKKIAQNKGRANQIAAGRTETRVNQEFDRQVAEMLSKPNTGLTSKVRAPLERRRALPQQIDFSTTSEALYMNALAATRFQIAAPSPPPKFRRPNDLAIRLHESFVNNLIASLFGGETLTAQRVDALAVEFAGKEIEKPEDEEPWSITFARNKPVTVLFDNQIVSVTIRGARYTSGAREFSAMNVSARYQLEKTDQGLVWRRLGEVEIIPPGFQPGRDQLSPGQLALHTILEKKFAKIFVEERVGEGLQFEGAWSKAGRMTPAEAQADDGWLTLAWEIPSSDRVANAADGAGR